MLIVPPSRDLLRLFVDPASISTGWACFRGKEFLASGTIAVDRTLPPHKRNSAIYRTYQQLAANTPGKIDEAHIEQLVRNTHIYTHWSVGVIGAALSDRCLRVDADISISSWQKHTDWHGKRKVLEAYQGRTGSEDELAAIGMGLYFTNKFEIGD